MYLINASLYVLEYSKAKQRPHQQLCEIIYTFLGENAKGVKWNSTEFPEVLSWKGKTIM
jgi:hypothetical protein